MHSPEGIVLVDLSGKKVGRGAYLCATAQCWEIGLKGGRIEHALQMALTPENREKLVEYAKGLKEPSIDQIA